MNYSRSIITEISIWFVIKSPGESPKYTVALSRESIVHTDKGKPRKGLMAGKLKHMWLVETQVTDQQLLQKAQDLEACCRHPLPRGEEIPKILILSTSIPSQCPSPTPFNKHVLRGHQRPKYVYMVPGLKEGFCTTSQACKPTYPMLLLSTLATLFSGYTSLPSLEPCVSH